MKLNMLESLTVLHERGIKYQFIGDNKMVQECTGKLGSPSPYFKKMIHKKQELSWPNCLSWNILTAVNLKDILFMKLKENTSIDAETTTIQQQNILQQQVKHFQLSKLYKKKVNL